MCGISRDLAETDDPEGIDRFFTDPVSPGGAAHGRLDPLSRHPPRRLCEWGAPADV
jgi:hypothetical protein